MKIKVKVTKEVDVKYLKVSANVRYPEDASVDGVEDENGELMPLMDDETWCPVIDLETGIIIDWPKGTTADVHYKVCDDGEYHLLDADKNSVIKIDGYVPGMLAPKGGGYGDYIILEIDGEGKIDCFKPDLSEFENVEEND